eukprot:CAMPEP_0171319312 /NCGR_PEP_ID=MMETSP0816-20121228/95640_1 /TAXON_ID=420281 /ORGANISM="Proboscia inermis, Strain CCAP1064/1" /LENGTH=30 /DNA_ID= /DNA_START= /DNA_END= /DNA_ORIENTATION=
MVVATFLVGTCVLYAVHDASDDCLCGYWAS